MSGYGRGPNVSQYIANLNSIPAGQEVGQQQEIGNIDDDLAYFTNAELFDFDLGATGDDGRQVKGDTTDGSGIDFSGQFEGFFESGQPLQLNTNFASTNNFDPQLFQSPTSATFPAQQQTTQQGQQAQSESQHQAGASPNASSQTAGSKRAHSVSSPSSMVEEAAKMAAEEDKRRRNTAASARFRVKKKQREAALEKTAREMTDKVDQLQKRVSELEMENKWLRGLVVEKGITVKKEDDESQPEKDITVERIPDKQAKNGVGTKRA